MGTRGDSPSAWRRAFTLCTVSVSLFVMTVFSCGMMFSPGVASSFSRYGTELIPFTAIWAILLLTAIGPDV